MNLIDLVLAGTRQAKIAKRASADAVEEATMRRLARAYVAAKRVGAKLAAKVQQARVAKASNAATNERLASAVAGAKSKAAELRKATPKPAKSWPSDMGKPPVGTWKGMAAELAALKLANDRIAGELAKAGSIHAARCKSDFEHFERRFNGARKALNSTTALRAVSDARAHVRRHGQLVKGSNRGA
jgi:hypothetical protein